MTANKGNARFSSLNVVRKDDINPVKFLIKNGGDVKSHGNSLFSTALGNDSRDITAFLWEYTDKTEPLIIRYKSDIECDQCNRTVSIPEPIKQIECQHCSSIVKIDDNEWDSIFEDSIFLKMKTYYGSCLYRSY